MDSSRFTPAQQSYLPIPVDALQIGMFVAELDRPWLDTPFAMQGLLMETPQDLAQMRQYCTFVYIDPHRAAGPLAVRYLAPGNDAPWNAPEVPNLLAHKTSADKEPAASATTTALRAQQNAASTRFEQMKAALSLPDYSRSPSLIQRIFKNFLGTPTGPGTSGQTLGLRIEQDTEKLAQSLELPSHIRLTFHPDLQSVERELHDARRVYAQTRQIVDMLLTDVQEGVPLGLSAVNEVITEMVDSVIRNPDALLWLSRIRKQSAQTYGHSIRVAVYLLALGRYLGFPKEQMQHLGTIGLLLDVGKLRVPRELLEKPGALTTAEFAVIKQHVHLGLQELSTRGTLAEEVERGIAQHHERENGQGYPCGLHTRQISLYGRMAAIADTFAAITSARPYAPAMSPHDGLLALYQWSGSHFHTALVEQFALAIGVFPVGSLVELSSGEVATIIALNKVHRLQPRVLILTGPDKTVLPQPREADLLQQNAAAQEGLRIVRGLSAGAYGLNLRDAHLDQNTVQQKSD